MQKNIGKTISKGGHTRSVPFEELYGSELRDKKFAEGFLEASLEEADEPRLFALALQDVIKARGGFSTVADKIGMGREALYRAVSLKTTPKLEVVLSILRGLDLQITIPPRIARPPQKHALLRSQPRAKLRNQRSMPHSA